MLRQGIDTAFQRKIFDPFAAPAGDDTAMTLEAKNWLNVPRENGHDFAYQIYLAREVSSMLYASTESSIQDLFETVKIVKLKKRFWLLEQGDKGLSYDKNVWTSKCTKFPIRKLSF